MKGLCITAAGLGAGGAATNFSFPAAAAPASSFPSVHNIFAGTPAVLCRCFWCAHRLFAMLSSAPTCWPA